MVEVFSPRGPIVYAGTYRKYFYTRIHEALKNRDLPVDVVLCVRLEKNELPSADGKLVFVIGQRDWPTEKGKIEKIGELQVCYIPGGLYLQVSGLPDYPDDFGTQYSDAVIEILDRLLPQVIEKDPEKQAELIAADARAERIRSREAYVKECTKRFEKTVEGTKKAISDGKAAVAKLQAELVRKIRETKGVERKLEQLEASRGAQTEEYGQEFDNLLQVPKVRRVEAKEGKVNVFTEVLFCTDPRSGLRHEIGAFRIELDATRGVPKWYNLTRQVDACWSKSMAPHVDGNGEACLGNTAEIFPELIGNYEFAAAAMVAIQFVESVNTDDTAGKKIGNWPVAQDAPAKTANEAAV